jgi:PPM family protein phosphatase
VTPVLRIVESFRHTDTGRQRKANEDNLLVREPLFVVADGMGGARAGEVASQTAVEAFEAGLPQGGSAEDRLAEVIVGANGRIHGMAQSDDQLAGMGTTVTAAWVGEHDVSIAHVGDSRAYLFRDGTLQLLTQDHSLVNELVIRGKLTEEQAAEHPQRSIITRALGPEASVEVDTQSRRARGGDVFLLCSDGLTSMIDDATIADIVVRSRSLDEAGHALVQAANDAGGRDNITVVLFRVAEDGGADGEQPTEVAQLQAQEVRAAAAGQASRPSTGGAAPGAAPQPPRRTAPLPRRPEAHADERRRRRGRLGSLAFGLLFLALVLLLAGGTFLYARSHYFIGEDGQGFVTVHRGLDAAPLGVKLYSVECSTSVLADQVPAANRRSLDRRSRTDRDDAVAVVRTLYRKQLALGPGQPTPDPCTG